MNAIWQFYAFPDNQITNFLLIRVRKIPFRSDAMSEKNSRFFSFLLLFLFFPQTQRLFRCIFFTGRKYFMARRENNTRAIYSALRQRTN